jgi:hypothetical protein
MLRAEGFPKDFDRSHLEKYVSKLALISIKPLEGE